MKHARKRTKKKISTYKHPCKHLRDTGAVAIAWMEHSNKHIMGVCKLCFRQIDSKTRYGARLLRLSGTLAQRTMGRVLPIEPPKPWEAPDVVIPGEFAEESALIAARERHLNTPRQIQYFLYDSPWYFRAADAVIHAYEWIAEKLSSPNFDSQG